MDIDKLTRALPAVNSWINDYVSQHSDSRVRMSEAGFSRLPGYFSPQVLEGAFYVLVPKIEAPPLADFGLEGLSFFEAASYGGITYKDTFFVTSMGESLHFHEMIHVIQWDELGPEKFLLAYGVGLVQFGYWHSPLEQIAYSMQRRFDAEEEIEGLESAVRSHCRELMQQLSEQGVG